MQQLQCRHDLTNTSGSHIHTYGSTKNNTVYYQNSKTVVKRNSKGRDPTDHQSEVVDDEGVRPRSVSHEANNEPGDRVAHPDNGNQESSLGFVEFEILCQVW